MSIIEHKEISQNISYTGTTKVMFDDKLITLPIPNKAISLGKFTLNTGKSYGVLTMDIVPFNPFLHPFIDIVGEPINLNQVWSQTTQIDPTKHGNKIRYTNITFDYPYEVEYELFINYHNINYDVSLSNIVLVIERWGE